MKKVVIISAHPVKDSYCNALAEEYATGVRSSGAVVDFIRLRDFEFDPNLDNAYRIMPEMEKELADIQKKMKQADHLVFAFPNWWGSFPAVLKGFIDRTILPGYAFQYRKGKAFPEKFFSDKSARIIITMDTPPWFYKIVLHQPGLRIIKSHVLKFIGVKPVRSFIVGPVRSSSLAKRRKWLKKTRKLGIKMR